MYSGLFQHLCSFNIGFNEEENSLLSAFGSVADQDPSVAGGSTGRRTEQQVTGASWVPVDQPCRATAAHLATALRASTINC